MLWAVINLVKSYISKETPVLDSNPAARGWGYLFRL